MKKKWMIFSLALALLGASSVGTAYAYFTTNARADGEYGIELGNDTDITEDVDDLTKSIAVRNNENSQAVFVRSSCFTLTRAARRFRKCSWKARTAGKCRPARMAFTTTRPSWSRASRPRHYAPRSRSREISRRIRST